MTDKHLLNKSICVKCTHHTLKPGGGNSWYNHACAEPEVLKTNIDFVIGAVDYVFPICRSVNPNGNCPHYKPK